MKNIKIQLNKKLDEKLAIGTSRHEAKKAYQEKHPGEKNKSKTEKIHSIGTANTYRQSINEFGDWLRDNKPDVWNTKNLDAVDKATIYEYLKGKEEKGIAATSISRDISALNKILDRGLSKAEGGLEKRSMAKITRSRNETNAKLTPSLKVKNQQQITIARATGLRRCEILKIEKKDFIKSPNGTITGLWTVGKGGKLRIATVLEKHREEVKSIYQNMPQNGHVFNYYSGRIDNHSYRAEYCSNRYLEVMKHRELQGKDTTVDYKGYCSGALKTITQDMGHNRISVMMGHYLR